MDKPTNAKTHEQEQTAKVSLIRPPATQGDHRGVASLMDMKTDMKMEPNPTEKAPKEDPLVAADTTATETVQDEATEESKQDVPESNTEEDPSAVPADNPAEDEKSPFQELLDRKLVQDKPSMSEGGASSGGAQWGWLNAFMEKAEGTLNRGLEKFDHLVDEAVEKLEHLDHESTTGTKALPAAAATAPAGSEGSKDEPVSKKEGESEMDEDDEDPLKEVITTIKDDIGKAKGFLANAWIATVDALKEIDDEPPHTSTTGTESGERAISVPSGTDDEEITAAPLPGKNIRDVLAEDARVLIEEAKDEGRRLGSALENLGRNAAAFFSADSYLPSDEEDAVEASAAPGWEQKLADQKLLVESGQGHHAATQSDFDKAYDERDQIAMKNLADLSASCLAKSGDISTAQTSEDKKKMIQDAKAAVEKAFEPKDVEDPSAAANESIESDAACKDLQLLVEKENSRLTLQLEAIQKSSVEGDATEAFQAKCTQVKDAVLDSCVAICQQAISQIDKTASEISQNASEWQAGTVRMKNVIFLSQHRVEELGNLGVDSLEGLQAQGERASPEDTERIIGATTDDIYAVINASSTKIDQASGYAITIIRLAAITLALNV